MALTWDELRNWSDARSVERGKGYLSHVEPPVLFPDSGLVSEVHGSDDYFAKHRVDASGRLEGVCTCPVGVRCKHCVALALADELLSACPDVRPYLKHRLEKMRPVMVRLGRGMTGRLAWPGFARSTNVAPSSWRCWAP